MARAIYDKTASKNWPNFEQNGKSPPIDSLLEWCAHAYMPIYGQRRGGEARVGWFVLQSATLRHFEFEFRRGKTCTELRKGLLNCSVVQILTNRYVLQCPNWAFNRIKWNQMQWLQSPRREIFSWPAGKEDLERVSILEFAQPPPGTPSDWNASKRINRRIINAFSVIIVRFFRVFQVGRCPAHSNLKAPP